MKKRILFVDDDIKVLEFYRMLFESDAAAWEIEVAGNGIEALEILANARCDVLVCNWRLPQISGLEIFTEATKRRPNTARIVVSDLVDQEEIAKALWGAHQFIRKPIDRNLLRSTICRVCSIQNAAIDQTIAALLSDDYSVPTLPSLYFQVLRAMDSPDASVTDVGEIISQDPAMVAKILQLVNSAYFGIARRISSPVEAVQILGLQKVRALLLSVHVFACFDTARMKSFPLSRLWNHSIAASAVAQKICRAERADKTLTEEVQLACMLHDVGKVILASGEPDRYQRAVALALEAHIPLTAAETEIFGATHAEVGAFLLSRWGMPITVIEAIALHHHPDRSAIDCFSPLTATHVATCLETELRDPIMDTLPTAIDTDYLARIGLAHRLPVWREVVEEVEALTAVGSC